MATNLNLGDKVKVDKPKTKDPEVVFTLTGQESGAFNGIRYAFGSLHYFDGPSTASGDHTNHMEVGKASSGDTPISGNSATLKFTFNDGFWDAAAKRGDQIHYYLLVTYHGDTAFNGKAFKGTFTPSATKGDPVANPNDPDPVSICATTEVNDDTPGPPKSLAAKEIGNRSDRNRDGKADDKVVE